VKCSTPKGHMSSSKVMLSTSKAPRYECSSSKVQCSSSKGSKAPMLLQSYVLLQIHHTYMITPSTQASISQVQASMQAIQVCPCHLGLNALLQNAKHSSSKARHPPSKQLNLHVAIMKKSPSCLKVSNTPRKKAT
jgi:hypothetical protein